MAKMYNNFGLKIMERREHDEALVLVRGQAGSGARYCLYVSWFACRVLLL